MRATMWAQGATRHPVWPTGWWPRCIAGIFLLIGTEVVQALVGRGAVVLHDHVTIDIELVQDRLLVVPRGNTLNSAIVHIAVICDDVELYHASIPILAEAVL